MKKRSVKKSTVKKNDIKKKSSMKNVLMLAGILILLVLIGAFLNSFYSDKQTNKYAGGLFNTKSGGAPPTPTPTPAYQTGTPTATQTPITPPTTQPTTPPIPYPTGTPTPNPIPTPKPGDCKNFNDDTCILLYGFPQNICYGWKCNEIDLTKHIFECEQKSKPSGTWVTSGIGSAHIDCQCTGPEGKPPNTCIGTGIDCNNPPEPYCENDGVVIITMKKDGNSCIVTHQIKQCTTTIHTPQGLTTPPYLLNNKCSKCVFTPAPAHCTALIDGEPCLTRSGNPPKYVIGKCYSLEIPGKEGEAGTCTTLNNN